MTGDAKYLEAAKRFSHKAFLEPLSKGVDNLDNKHANTQIPKFIGFERIAQLGNEMQYHAASTYFWETVTAHRTLAFGGNSRREHFPSKEASIDYVIENDGPETCNSYNMLKLTEDLFHGKPDAKYVDYYERTLYNHILSSQHPEHGGYVYFTAARPRHYRVYSAPNEAMWCCVGTGMENHGKYNQFIYTHTKNELNVNLFIASELNWKEQGVKIRQDTKFPFEDRVQLTVTEGKAQFNLMVRYPGWVAPGAFTITVNGKPVAVSSGPASYVGINRKWKKGDKVEITLPMRNTIEHLPNVPEYVAFLHGPILLGAPTGTEDLKGLIADDGRWAQHSTGAKLPIDQAPILIEDDLNGIPEKLKPVPNTPLQFSLDVKAVNPIAAGLKPFFQIHDSRYMIYWLALTPNGYKGYVDSLSNMEKKKLDLETRTVDHVTCGEQQPETDHAMKKENSTTGNNLDAFFREAHQGGYFSYELATGKESNLSLYVRYYGAEWGNRNFEIYIDDQKLLTVNNTGRWNVALLQDEEYPIPEAMLSGKEKVTVKFQAIPGNTAGGVYTVRLLRGR
jgi:hypothetical protein